MTKQIVLPADVYDTLEFSALVYGGIGSGTWREGGRPVCYVGHLACAGVIASEMFESEPFGINEEMNDEAVAGAFGLVAPRIPFVEWCKRLNVVRGK
jgi:hypothetical protein